MKLLVATEETQGHRASDFTWCTSGEMVSVASRICDRDREEGPDGGCGCGRSFSGLESGKATTTAIVRDVDGYTFDDLIEAVRSRYYGQAPASGFLESDAGQVVAEEAALIAATAARYGEGTVLEIRLGEISARPVLRALATQPEHDASQAAQAATTAAYEALEAWAAVHEQRDEVILAAVAAGISKSSIQKITGVSRATIGRIIAAWEPARCGDCQLTVNPAWTPDAEYEWYMVHDQVWQAAGAGEDVCLCIGCLEGRLGRQLTAADFTDAPVNSLGPEVGRYAWSQRSERLSARLTAGLDPDVLAGPAASRSA